MLCVLRLPRKVSVDVKLCEDMVYICPYVEKFCENKLYINKL